MSSVDRFARRLNRVERDIKNGATQPRLPYSSIDGGSLQLFDNFGNLNGVLGQQYDGTNTMAPLGGTPPPSPSVPLVTPVSGGLAAYWDGTWVDGSVTRMDFRRVTFHAVTDVELFDALDPAQIVGEITIATGGEIFATLPPVEYFVFAVAWTDAGKFSFESDVAFGTPLSLVDDEAWQAHEDALDELNTVSLPALQNSLDNLNTVTLPGLQAELDAAAADVATLTDSTIPDLYNQITLNYDLIVEVDDLTEGWRYPGDTTINGGAIRALTVTTNSLAANAVTAAKIAANTITANQMAANTITSNEIAANTILAANIGANQIVAGKLAVDAVTAGALAADAITAKHTLTGPTIQSHPSANTGLKIVGSVLTAYDGSGNARFVANGSTGEVVAVGKFMTGFAGSKRLEVGTGPSSDPLVGDISSINFFSGSATEALAASIASGSGPGALYITAGRRTDTPVGAQVPNINMFAPSGTGPTQLGGTDILAGGNFNLSATNGSVSTTAVDLVESSVTIAKAGLRLTASGASSPDILARVRGDFVVQYSNDSDVANKAVLIRANKNDITLGKSLRLGSAALRIYQSGISGPRVNDEGWVAANVVNGGALDPATYGSIAYRLVNGVVYLRGCLTGYAAGNTNFNLPAGLRPSFAKAWRVQGGPSGQALVQVFSSGNVIVMESTTFAFLDSISFPVDQ